MGADPRSHNYSTHSFGAQFVEVEWDPGIARLRVSRVVSVVDGGRIMNKSTATNQMAGAIVMGVGMGLFEETIYDPRNGHPINDNFADYIVPTIADTPQIDVHFLDIPDPLLERIWRAGHRRDWFGGYRTSHYRGCLSRYGSTSATASCAHRRPARSRHCLARMISERIPSSRKRIP